MSLALPSAACAENYVVNDTGDEADAIVGTAGCLTAGLKCSLRAAIQESNFSTSAKDSITFAPAFNGQLIDTIAIGASFPVIADSVTIDGDAAEPCTTAAAGAKGPCVGVEKTGGGFGLVVEDDDVTIEGLAVTAALIGIDVINASEGFTARDNWVGLKLDGTAGANNTGIFVDPNSNEASIGGLAAPDRNVIADNNLIGLDVEGADDAAVSGNYFGVAPDGFTPAPNAVDIEVTDSTAGAFQAEGNEIGSKVSPAAAATDACDGGCNVIAGAIATGLDLQGNGALQNEAPASGPTLIRGNYVGLGADGAEPAPNLTTGISVGGADEATVGGGTPEEANHIHGGTFGILAGQGAEDLLLQGNLIGLNPAGTETLSPPGSFGIFDDSENLADPALATEISGNRISMPGGEAIVQHGSGATIVGNAIGRGVGGQALSGATIGIYLYGNQSFGSTIEGNVIENSVEKAILIKDDENVVAGNEIVGAGNGIYVQSFGVFAPATENLIGGDTLAEQNTISGSKGAAIVIAEDEDEENEIARNIGSGNGGLFIDLGDDGPGNAPFGPNDGAQAPVISSATTSGASGTAEPGALVRVFRKASAVAGEIESFLGEAVANGSGNWTVPYGSAIPGGTFIAATQTDTEGTSELNVASTKFDNPIIIVDPEPPPVDKTPPETTIRKGPKGKSHSTAAKFKFTSSEAGSAFQCKLDKKPFKPCRSPKKYKGLKPGKHVFKVRAIDKAGNADPSPAKKKFKVLG